MDEKKNFEPRLESLRGIASLYVAVHHALYVFDGGAYREFSLPLAKPLQWLLEDLSNPDMAVLFFFVLSGYVLGRSLERESSYGMFILRRALRILPAFFVSVVVAYGCIELLRIDPAPAGLTAWFNSIFWPAPALQQLYDNLIMKSSTINGPTWSIYWEVVGSISLPFLFYWHRATPRWFQVPLFLGTSVFILFAHTRAAMLPIVEYFYAGFFLPAVIARVASLHWFLRVAAFIAGYWIILEVGPRPDKAQPMMIAGASVGGALMIAAVISSDHFLNWLRTNSMRFIGRVSYSFYLLHWPILYVTAIIAIRLGTPEGTLGNWILCFVSVVVALAASAVSYRWVEMPCVALGKTIFRPRKLDLINVK